MDTPVAFIGFGEAAQAFAGDAGWRAAARAFDLKTSQPATRAAMLEDYARNRVCGAEAAVDALAGAKYIFSLVTADEALNAARSAVGALERQAFYFDMNSVSPGAKRAASEIIEGTGGRYVDVAVMSPVHPKRLATPLLVSGPRAADGVAALTACGFSSVKIVGDAVGRASAIKMIRSVMVKGIEALTAECVLAAHEAGVIDEVTSSLGADWADKADYNLDRMLVHGIRRAAEMDEVVQTLEELGVSAPITQAAAVRQHAIGSLNVTTPPEGLRAKIERIKSATTRGKT